MDLKEFIRESLVQISTGIIEANTALTGTNAVVNPAAVKAYSTEAKAFGRIDPAFDKKQDLVHLVTFDVALHAESGTEAGGGLKLAIAAIGVDGGGKKRSLESSASRIRFEIPMKYPSKQ